MRRRSVFYGAGDEAWKRTVDAELKKVPGFRGERPPLASFTYLAGLDSDHKKDLIELEEPSLIDGRGGFVEDQLTPLMAALKA